MADEPLVIVSCVLRDEKFVEPCDALRRGLEDPFGRGTRSQGLKAVNLINMDTRKPSRSFICVKSGAFSKRGMALNFCPFCGVNINTYADEMAAA